MKNFRYNFFSGRKGFSLLETLAVIGISMALFVIAGTQLYSYRQQKELSAVVSSLSIYISVARQKAMVAEDDVNWGIHLESSSTPGYSFYSLFAGSAYSLPAEKEKKVLPVRIRFNSPSFGQTKDFIFEKYTGRALSGSATSTALYALSAPSSTKMITVNSLGKISIQ